MSGEPVVFWDGEFVPASQAHPSLSDRGWLFGDGLFETLRSYRGRPFALDRHLDRLYRSAPVIGLTIPYAKDELAGVLQELISANGLSEAYLRLTVTRGTGAAGRLAPAGDERPLVWAAARALEPRPERPWKVIVLPAGWAPPSPLAGIKSLNFLVNILGRMKACEQGADEALMVNAGGLVTEATSANLFLVKAGRLLTPALECGVLPGIVRGLVVEMAGRLGIECAEGKIAPSELGGVAECFLTNSIIEIRPVGELDGRGLAEGPVVARLRQEYRRMVAEQIGEPPSQASHS